MPLFLGLKSNIKRRPLFLGHSLFKSMYFLFFSFLWIPDRVTECFFLLLESPSLFLFSLYPTVPYSPYSLQLLSNVSLGLVFHWRVYYGSCLMVYILLELLLLIPSTKRNVALTSFSFCSLVVAKSKSPKLLCSGRVQRLLRSRIAPENSTVPSLRI